MNTARRPVQSALLSVTDKTGLVSLARSLRDAGFILYATASTRSHLAEALEADAVLSVEALTGFPEILDGRVKTLHPKVFGGLLARATEEHDATLAAHGLPRFDLLVCNLYAFEEAARITRDPAALIEKVDIGGVSLLRAAAKNHESVTVLCDPADYESYLKTCVVPGSANAETQRAFRIRLALKAFERTAAYDACIAATLAEAFAPSEKGALPDAAPHRNNTLPLQAEEAPPEFPARLKLTASLAAPLRYGENPHQKAALYMDAGVAGGAGLTPFGECLQGKELSYNNLLDVEHALRLAADLPAGACVIVKHNQPCGVGLAAGQPEAAFAAALESDKVSPFGGIVVFRDAVDAVTAEALAAIFLEVIVAPEFSAEARTRLAAKKNLRLILAAPAAFTPFSGIRYTRILSGWLAQSADRSQVETLAPEARWAQGHYAVKTKRVPTAAEMRALAFAETVVKHARSNAIVLAQGDRTVAIAGGFTNRVDAVEHCLRKAPKGLLAGAVLASDAFFPFPDSIELLRGSGIRAVIQPGGSVQDAAVIDACERAELSLTFTGIRHFKH